ncbi:HD-GYP domain-containing protein [Novilysobacter defluvii]|uniref:HD-GYP domain-containing protein n=1 Tax=Novilysobacter defluvii TaxID=391738 RepID=UPI000420D5C0|nr:HD-GYP domain-containing protein [Lysobacter defluvii]
MKFHERQIPVDRLAEGMYVCRLDRAWEGTPFPLQGFLVDSAEELDWVRANCETIWIDVTLGPAPPDEPRQQSPEELLGSRHYHDTAAFAEELPQAHEALSEAARTAERLFTGAASGGRLDAEEVRSAVEPVVESLLRNADTLLWVNALRASDGYAYSHAIHCSMLAAAFGRHLGLPAELLVDMASGGLLLDIGKTRLPQDLLTRPGPLTHAEMTLVRRHVGQGAEVLEESGGHGPDVIEMVRTHHERWDGTGYPNRLAGTSIPLYGRIAAIIDAFDAMISPRPWATTRSRHQALQVIYEARDSAFQGELVEQFISCLGAFPTGSLVELSNGQVGVVMMQNPSRRLRPRIMLLTDADKSLLPQFQPMDLMDQPEDLPADEQINVVCGLAVGTYGLDPAELYL